MKRYTWAVVTLGLVGCTVSGPQKLVHKTGSTHSERMAALDNCQFEAIRAVPRAMGVASTGGYYNPGSIQCSTIGNSTSCNRVGAVNIPSTTYSYDANQELRERYIDRCLWNAGFETIEKPVCRTQQEAALYQSTINNQPPAAEIPCVVPR